ncbi:MAG: pyridoxamine 5'-phosphate oxidase family protein [Flavobacteriales bacterium]|nr:pyridoxamine 5'-phosphate oxidase family protein [Flavobacteriales bacterium]MCB9204181.1 pyridoxamine 5'-phosphate oxidase family protein [Flavobacteriales bacterium]
MSLNVVFEPNEHEHSELIRSITEILESTQLWSMATVSPSGTPHINTAYFSYDENFRFYFITSPHTQHGKFIEANPEVAVSIFSTDHPWQEVPFRGIQLWGKARNLHVLASPTDARASYCNRFPKAADWIGPEKQESRSDVHDRFFDLEPTRLKLFDEKLFGQHTLIELKIADSYS